MSVRMLHRVTPVLVVGILLLLPGSALAATVTTDAAGSVTDTSAVLNGTAAVADTDSAWYFRYGTSTSYDQATPQQRFASAGSQPVTAAITGLQPGTTYHFRLVVVENLSSPTPTTTSGQDQTFTTTGSTLTSVATTGGTTSLTSTSAVLNGVANSSSSDSAFVFQYGTDTNYGKLSGTKAIGSGLLAVSAPVSGLKPNTTYHYRLEVIAGSYPRQFFYGADSTFTTKPPTATASLRSKRLKVHGGALSVPIKCAGDPGSSCKGKASVTARGRHGKQVGCGSAGFSLAAGRQWAIKVRITHACAALLTAAKDHSIKAKLKVKFSTPQAPLNAGVTLYQG